MLTSKTAPEKKPVQTRNLERKFAGIPFMDAMAYGLGPADVTKYDLLPTGKDPEKLPDSTPCWRIELHPMSSRWKPIGIDIIGDIRLGRKGEIDIDLDSLDGVHNGISRKHLLIRPTKDNLFLIDLGSTNGTRLNGMFLSRSETRRLTHDDTLSLGTLNLKVKIIKQTTLSKLRAEVVRKHLQDSKPDSAAADDTNEEKTIQINRKHGEYPEGTSLWMISQFEKARYQYREIHKRN